MLRNENIAGNDTAYVPEMYHLFISIYYIQNVQPLSVHQDCNKASRSSLENTGFPAAFPPRICSAS